MQPSPPSEPNVRLSPHPALQRRRDTLTRPFPFLTEPQWHQGQSPRLCPLGLQGQCRLSFSPSWQSFTLSRTLHPGLWLLRCLRPPSHTLAFSRPLPRQSGRGVPQFQDIRRIEIPLAACCRPGACGTTYRHRRPVGTRHRPLFGSGVSATFTCSLSRSVITGFLRQPRNQVWSVDPSVASSRRTVVPGLPTLTSATYERRPGRPYTVVHV